MEGIPVLVDDQGGNDERQLLEAPALTPCQMMRLGRGGGDKPRCVVLMSPSTRLVGGKPLTTPCKLSICYSKKLK